MGRGKHFFASLRSFLNRDRLDAARRGRRALPARRGRGKLRRLPLGVESLEERVVPSANLVTDRTSYAAGTTAVIAGSGFAANESVTLQVTHSDGTAAAGKSPWVVTADATGSFQTAWYADPGNAAGTGLVLAATGAQGDAASSTFTETAATAAAAVVTDQADYPAGATAQITGTGFVPNESVNLEVVHSDTGQPADGSNPWSVTAAADGSFTSTWYVNPSDEVGASLTLSATGSQGDSASTTFTDGSTNLVTNGGFETGSFSGWTRSGNTGFTGVTGYGTPQGPHSGNDMANLGPVGSLGFLSQTIATTPRAQYSFSWWLESDGATPNQFRASWGGNIIFNQVNVPYHGWQQYSYTETATGTSTTIQLGFRNDPGYLYLDDVSVVATSLPAPSISSLNQASAAEGSSSFTLTVNGNNFTSSTAVNWNGTPLTTNLVNGALQATVPASDLAEEGSATITVSNSSGTSNGVPFSVSDPAVAATGVAVSATEGAAFSGAVATFTDPGGTEPADGTHYTATINWGDNSPTESNTTITLSGSTFTVSGSHTYAEEGTYTVTTFLNHEGVMTTTSSTARAADAALADTTPATTYNAVASQSTGDQVLATFTDADPNATPSDFTLAPPTGVAR